MLSIPNVNRASLCFYLIPNEVSQQVFQSLVFRPVHFTRVIFLNDYHDYFLLQLHPTIYQSSRFCLNDQNPPDLILTFHSFSTTILHTLLSNVWRGFPGGSDGKESACNVGDPGSNSGLGRSPGEGNGNPLQYSCLENPKDKEAWQATIHGVAKKSDTTERQTFHFIFHTLLINQIELLNIGQWPYDFFLSDSALGSTFF